MIESNTSNRDNRVQRDRRSGPTPILSKYTLSGGRRKTIRRETEKSEHLFVDLYSTRLLVAAISLLLLSCLDAYLTLTLIERGRAVEANPIMAYFLNHGIVPFTVIKISITVVSLSILCLFKNVRITRIGLPLAIKIYIGIVVYEFYIYLA